MFTCTNYLQIKTTPDLQWMVYSKCEGFELQGKHISFFYTQLGQKVFLNGTDLHSLHCWSRFQSLIVEYQSCHEHHFISTFVSVTEMLKYFQKEKSRDSRTQINHFHRSQNLSQNVHLSYYKTC